MKIKEHLESSLNSIRKNYPEIYGEKRDVLEELLLELHKWFDAFAGKKSEDYDYSNPRFCIRHREQRHHIQGIRMAVEIFSKHYGRDFAKLIGEEAERHVREDMERIPFESDYKKIGFWNNPFGID